ncbi:MAG: 50S ribosomal protein L11 methyltransferase [Candidatus Levybacteria bacterium]|nr:50S ribosomal protein L11 methyltransferase [Candidatus Levybacteria bacterium]
MAVLIIIAIVLVILLYLLSMVWPPDSPWSPWWRTSPKIARIQCKLAKIKKGDIVYDLGSGEGTALMIAAREFGATGVGIEIDPFRVLTSKLSIATAKLSSQIQIERKNFFDIDISRATVVIMYLIPKTMARLKPKLLKELKPGTRVVTFVYKIDLPMIAADEKNEVYVYEVPRKRIKH